jgi:aminoglycoside phosphotransferase (APT) family kinase protein
MEAFTGTKAPSQAIAAEALTSWLSAHLDGFAGPLSIEQFKGGQSNPTYKLNTPSQAYVMRSKPAPAAKLLPSAHAIEREFAVMSALAGSEVPVPRMLALCEDESVIGRAFYIMEFMPGRVLWDPALPGMNTAERAAIYEEMNRVIAALHRVNPQAIGLANYGKPGNYFERQIGRWSKQYLASITEPIEAMDRLMVWLPANIPASARDEAEVAIVHGDFRLDNLVFHPEQARVIAVLDWELSTLGHPLADFSYHCMTWHIQSSAAARGLAGLDLAALGIPFESDYVRIAAILQGIGKRVSAGTASNDQAQAAAAGARPLAELAWSFAQRQSHQA